MSVFAAPAGRGTPRGLAKLLAINWSLVVLLAAIASAGFLMLYSVADGSLEPWAEAQMIRFGIGVAGMIAIGMIDIRFWRLMAPVAYAVSLLLLVAVDVMGVIGMGAQRWIALGPIQIQPSEMMKIALATILSTRAVELSAASRIGYRTRVTLAPVGKVEMILRERGTSVSSTQAKGAFRSLFAAPVQA